MPLAFQCQKGPPPGLPPIPIPGLDGIMSSDGVAKVFNLDPRLQDGKSIKYNKMAPRQGGFLDSLRASFSTKGIRTDPSSGLTRKGKGKEKETEKDLSFVILPRSASSLIPSKTSMPLPPMPRRDDRLPRHSNIFTGVPTPTDSAATSARNSQHPSTPGTPVHEHLLRSSRSVPDWTIERRKQYYYTQDAGEDELPRIPSIYDSQSISNPGTAVEEIGMLEGVVKGDKVSGGDSPKLTSIGRYKRKQVASRANSEAFYQQRSSMKSIPLVEKSSTKRKETQNSFLPKDGPGNGNILLPVSNKLLQQPDQGPIPSTLLQPKQMQTCQKSITEDPKHTSSVSHRLPGRPTSTSTYRTHRGHALFPVVEEALQPIHIPEWNTNWSPHIQQESELFFETRMGDVTVEQTPVEMGIPSPRHKHKARPASWACPTQPIGIKVSRIASRSENELDFMFPPTPPSSTGDVWDDHNYGNGEQRVFWIRMRNFWNIFVMIWALILVFKSLQFLVRIVDFVVLEPGKFLCDVFRSVAQG